VVGKKPGNPGTLGTATVGAHEGLGKPTNKGGGGSEDLGTENSHIPHAIAPKKGGEIIVVLPGPGENAPKREKGLTKKPGLQKKKPWRYNVWRRGKGQDGW